MANHIHGIIGFDENGVGGHIMGACQDCNETLLFYYHHVFSAFANAMM